MAGENEDPNAEGAEGAADDSQQGGDALPSLFDTISNAVDNGFESNDPTGDEETGEEGDGNAEDELESEGDEAGGEEEGDEGSGEGDQPRGADGKYAKADGTGKTGEGAEKGADGKPVQPDPVNDPIPDEIKGRTRERMSSLIETVKQKDAIIEDQHTVLRAVQQSGATPEEFAAMVSYMVWAHSDNPKDLTQARDLLIAELEGISLKLGEPAPGINFVSKYEDIQAQLDAGQITPEAANELAIGRAKKEATARAEAARTQNDEATRQRATNERNAAIKDLDTLGSTLSDHDPDFAEKMKLMPSLKAIGAKTPPSKWRETFQTLYKAAGATLAKNRAAAAANGGKKPVPKQPPKGQPLRANKNPSSSTGGNRKPTSLLDAISTAIDEADQR